MVNTWIIYGLYVVNTWLMMVIEWDILRYRGGSWNVGTPIAGWILLRNRKG